MNAVGYFPGCSLEGSAPEYDASVRAVAAVLGTDLQPVPDWTCCGASSAHAIDRDGALVLAASTLASASRAGIVDLLAPCAMCFHRLATTSRELAERPQLDRRVTAALAQPDDAPLTRVRVLSLLQWLDAVGPEALAAKVVRRLAGLQVACYYGCLLTRPSSTTGADAEAPRGMERLVETTGAAPVRWPLAIECCGGSFSLSRKSVVLRQARRLLGAARQAGADVVCVACPMCHANLDLRQRELDAVERPLPVVYLTQLLGLALGAGEDALGLATHLVPAGPVIAAALQRGAAAKRGAPCRG